MLRRYAPILVLCGVASISILLYSNTFRNLPVWDDTFDVVSQPFLHDCNNLRTLVNPRYLFWVLPVKNAARPVWLASVTLDSCVYGTSYGGFRLTNMLWHCAGALLLAGLVSQLTRRRWLGALSALFFAAHPVHTEAVNLIAFRGDLMAFAFVALSLLLYLRFRGSEGWRSSVWLGGSLISYALGMLSKEMAVTLPALIAVVDIIFPSDAPLVSVNEKPVDSRQSGVTEDLAGVSANADLGIDADGSSLNFSRRAPAYAAFALMFLGYLVFRTPRSGYVIGAHQDLLSAIREEFPGFQPKVQPGMVPPPPQLIDPPPWNAVYENLGIRFLTMSKVFGDYLRLLAWPHPLQGDYAPAVVETIGNWKLLCSWLAWTCLFAYAWFCRRRNPAMSFGLLWIPLTLLPVSGLIAIRNIEAERYVYLASGGFCIVLAAFIMDVFPVGIQLAEESTARSALVIILATLFTGAYGTLTMIRNRDYRDNLTFYLATVRQDPNVPRARINLGTEYETRGEWEEAEIQYREALRQWPRTIHGRLLLANLLVNHGGMKEGLKEFDIARRAARDNPEVQYMAGLQPFSKK